MGRLAAIITLLVLAALHPAIASAQGSITGVVTDTSVRCYPAFTVEVASPALIEKVRSAVDDGNRTVSDMSICRPRCYTVTFTLAGFNTLKRDGDRVDWQLHGHGERHAPRRLAEETLDCHRRGATVDVQNTFRQRNSSIADIIENIPAGETSGALGALNPGITTNVPQDVGGAVINATTGMSSARRPQQRRLDVDGRDHDERDGLDRLHHAADLQHGQRAGSHAGLFGQHGGRCRPAACASTSFRAKAANTSTAPSSPASRTHADAGGQPHRRL